MSLTKSLTEKLLYYGLVLFLVVTAQIVAQEQLTLDQCLRLSLQNSIDIGVARHLPDIAEADVLLAQSPYDIFATGGYQYSRTDSRLLQEKTGIFNIGVAKRFVTGTELSLGYDLEYRRSSEFQTNRELNYFLAGGDPTLIDPNTDFKRLWTSGVTLSATQPLLRNFGFGKPNQALIDAADKQKEIAEHELASQVNAVLGQVEVAYWYWVFSLKNKEILSQSVAKAKQYKSFVEPQSGRIGGVLPSDVSDANVNIYSREDKLITLEKELKVAQDRLKRHIYPFNPQDPLQMNWDKNIAPTASEVEQFSKITEIKPDVANALKYRPEVKLMQAKQKSFALLVERSENQMLPSLDVKGGITFLGEEESGDSAFKKGYNGDHYRWSVGVVLEVPLGNFAAKSELQRSKSQMEQAETELHKTQYDILLEIRTAVHEVEAARAKYEKNKATVDEAAKSLASLERRYERPLPGDLNFIFFLQDAEFKMTDASLVQNLSLLEYRAALARLKVAEAGYLKDYYQQRGTK